MTQMSTREFKRTLVPISFSASNVLQFLAAMACFLAAFVLPINFADFEGALKYLLLALGVGSLVVMTLSMLFRPWLTVIAQKIGFRSRMLLPREGIVYLGIMLIIAIAALTGGNPDTGNMLLLIFGMMAGPFVLNGWVVVAMLARVNVSRCLPVSVSAGTWFSVEIRMKNEKRLLSSRLVEVRDVIQGKNIRDEGKVVFVRVAPREQRSAHYDICISDRGLYQFGPLRLSSRFPLGIGERGHVVTARDEVIVYPKTGRLLPAWKRRERELAESTSRANARVGLFDDEFHGIREYRSGDNPRAIHWRSSARRGHFMVKEHEQHREADLIVLLDLCSSSEFSKPLQERTISLAATICIEQTRQSSSGRYRLMIAGRDLQAVECSGARSFRDAALKELAVCEPSPKAELASMLLAVCQSYQAPNSRFVLITPRPESARLLADSIAHENLRHEQQFIGRLMIVKADEQTLNATLAMDVDAGSETQQPAATEVTSASAGMNNRPMQTAAWADSGSPVLNISDKKLQSAFFRSMTLTTAMAGVVLCRSEGNYFPAALTPIVAIVAWIFVDDFKWVRLPTWSINLCGLAAIMVSMYNFGQGTVEDTLLAGSHMLVYLTCIVLMMQKGHRQYWWLIALTLLQMTVAAVQKTGLFFGGAVLMMMALLLWTLSVFSLYRVMDQHTSRNLKRDALSKRSGQDSASDGESSKKNGWESLIQVRDGLQRDSSEAWVGWQFRSMVSGSFMVSLVLAVFVFAAFPRIWEQGATTLAADLARESGLASQSGFKDTVTLGHVGRVTLSQQRVLFFSVTSLKTRKPVSAEQFAAALGMDEVRFRGIVLGRYHRGRWSIGPDELELSSAQLSRDPVLGSGNLEPEFRVEITQDAPVGFYAFAPYPVLKVSVADKLQIQRHLTTGEMIWRGTTDSKLPRTLVVECPRLDPTADSKATPEYRAIPQPVPANIADQTNRETRRGSGNRRDRRDDRDRYVERNIADDLPRLDEMTKKLCTKDGRLVSESDRIRKIMEYLSVENGFVYSTMQTRQNRSIDPVEDFVLNTKSGHCEYYASACALMLKSVQVPSRLVNGYYGSDMNSVTGINEVRQRHAHSWVEVFLDGRWETLDPTPSAPRREMISTGQTESPIGDLQSAISDLWNDRVHNMSAERQKEFFAPVISTSKSMYDTIVQKGLLNATWSGILSFLMSPESWFSWRGGALTVLSLLVSWLIYRVHPMVILLRAVKSLRTQFSEKQRARRSVIRFYAGFCNLCESHGMQFPAAASALENGRSAIERFKERLQSEELRQMPIRIAMAFNEVRFGKAELTDEQAASIGKDLTVFADALSKRRSLTG